jgi:branched-chain amino acid transport system permease protein
MLLQFLINGLVTGLLYAVASLSFALVYNTTRIFHIALAVLYVGAAYIFWHLGIVFQLPLWLAFLLSLLLTAVISLGIEKWVYYPLHLNKSSLNVILVSSIGVFIIMTNVVAVFWGNETKTMSSDISKVYLLGEIIITSNQALQFFASLTVISLFFTMLKFSRIGIKIRAIRDDPELYQILGFSIAKIRSLVFIISGVLIAVASTLTAKDIGMDPYVGMPILLNAIVALIIGGLGRFESCVIGGILLGIIQALVIWQWSAQWQEAITFIVLILFLFLRPQGLIGEKSRAV